MAGEFLMLSWTLWRGDAAAWDASLLQFADYTIYQSSGWDEHKSHFGWMPHRLIATENGKTVAMAQVRRPDPDRQEPRLSALGKRNGERIAGEPELAA